MNQAKTIQFNPWKIQNDPILPRYMNPAKTIQKNPWKFGDDPILPL